MDKKQFATLAIAIKAAYPASKVLEDSASMDFWYLMLKDIDYHVAENAAMEHISTSVYPPSIAELRKLCVERCTRAIPSFDEAWGTVQKAISSCGRDNPDRAYAMMDDMTASIVKNLGWIRICISENPEANRANFRMAYEEKAKQRQIARQMPRFVEQQKQQLIEQYAPQAPAIEQKQQPQIDAKEDWHGTPPPEDVKRRMCELFGRPV